MTFHHCTPLGGIIRWHKWMALQRQSWSRSRCWSLSPPSNECPYGATERPRKVREGKRVCVISRCHIRVEAESGKPRNAPQGGHNNNNNCSETFAIFRPIEINFLAIFRHQIWVCWGKPLIELHWELFLWQVLREIESKWMSLLFELVQSKCVASVARSSKLRIACPASLGWHAHTRIERHFGRLLALP